MQCKQHQCVAPYPILSSTTIRIKTDVEYLESAHGKDVSDSFFHYNKD